MHLTGHDMEYKTLRDEFATVMLTRYDMPEDVNLSDIAKCCYAMADAMMEVRKHGNI